MGLADHLLELVDALGGGWGRHGLGAGSLVAMLVGVLWIAPAGVHDRIRAWRRAPRRAAHGGGRWWGDGDWAADRTECRIAGGSESVALPALTVVPALVAGSVALWGSISLPLLHLPMVLSAALLVVVLWPWALHGKLVVAWPSMPQFLGDRLRLHVGVSDGGARIVSPRVLLACVRDQGPRLVPGLRRPQILWCREARLPAAESAGPESFLATEFDPPDSLPGTDPDADDGVHWELVVSGVAGGRDVRLCVPVPVYRRAEPGRAPPAGG